MTIESLGRRELIAGVAGFGAMLAAAHGVNAQPKPTEPAKTPASGAAPAPGKPADRPRMKDAPPAAPISPQLAAIIESTARCVRDGRVCLARCTDHMAQGMGMMAECQRAVMNMLAVTEAMAQVAGYRNAAARDIKALTTACAQFCRACASACEPHKDHHEECKACMEACLACAKACEAYTG
jgi:Cys-rich four helix bundle protein (predicted Tat secretion target)